MCCATIRSDESHDSCDNRFANDLSSDQLNINLFFFKMYFTLKIILFLWNL